MAWDRHAELSRAVPQAQALADALAGNSDRSLHEAEEIAATIAWHVQREGVNILLHDYVASGLVRLDGMMQVAVVDRSGILRASTIEGFRPVDLSDRDHFRVHIQDRSTRLYVGKSVVGRVSGKTSLQLSRRIDDAQGHFMGVVVVSMAPSYLTDFYEALRVGDHGVVELVGKDDMTIRVRRSGPSTRVDIPLPGKSPLRRALTQSAGGSFTGLSGIDGIDRVFAYRTLQNYPVAVVVGFSVTDYLAIYRARVSALVIAGVVLSLLILSAELYRRQLSRQMQASLRRERESDLRRIEKAQRIESLFRAIPDAVVGFSADGRIDGYNPSLLSLLGWDKAATTDATPDDIARALLARDEGSDRPVKERHLAALLRGNPDECTVAETFRMAVPETVVYELRIERRAEAPAQTIALIRDVTAQTSIRDNEQDLNATLQAIGDAVIATDEEGRIKRFNSAAENLTGCRQQDVIGQHYQRILRIRNIATGDDAALPVKEVMKSGHLFRLAESRVLVTASEDERKVSISMAPLRRNEGDVHGVVMVLRDVSRQYLSDQALIRSEARYRQLITQSPYGVILGQDRTIKFANPKALEMLGARAAAEVLGKGPHDFLHPDWIPVVEERIARMDQYGEMAPTLEEKWIRLDGSSFDCEVTAVPYDIDGKPGALVMLTDITERKKAEAERDRFFELSLDLITLAEPTGRFRRVNPAFTRVLGWSAEELTGRPFIEFVHPDDREATLAEIRRNQDRIDYFENRYMCRDGSTRWLAWRAVAIDGMIYATARDVTDSRTATLQLEHARSEAEAASRSKSAFLAAMSHEIRTPMNGVIGMTEALAETELSDDQADMLSTIRQSAHSLLVIIDDILDFSKIEAGKLDIEFTDVALLDLVESLCSSMLPVAEKRGVELSLVVEADVPEYVVTDETRLRQVLGNLISNAVKFCGGRPGFAGQVSVRVAVHTSSPLELVFSVADNGIGMSEDTMSKLFRPFTQAEASTTRRFGGTGLGLAISRRLVDMMNGTVSVTSAPGEGATFSVSLRVDVPANAPTADPPPLRDVQCILAGNGYDRSGVAAWLQRAGARIVTEQAFNSADRESRLPSGTLLCVQDEPDHSDTAHILPDSAAASLLPAQVWIKAGVRGALQRVRDRVASIGAVGLQRRPLLDAASLALGRTQGALRRDNSPSSARPAKGKLLSVDEARERGQLILVAEDDEVNQRVILRQLAILGHVAEIANNGQEALALWRKHQYALMFTDLHMPEMDGYELVTTIRAEERGARRPIIALTANAIQGEATRAIAVGMDAYLTKPLQLDRLKAVLHEYLAEPEHPEVNNMPISESARPASGTLDLAVLRSVVGDDPDVVRELLGEYLRSVQRLSVELRDHCMAARGQDASAVAHKLKSSSRSVGALGVGDLCARLEGIGKSADSARLQAWVREFDVAIEAVKGEIARLLESELK
ncbi:PAS domain S-box protein [Paraburkholderia franconis]|nr:PAS domain S-box protein [Paraburkholderia franconis]